MTEMRSLGQRWGTRGIYIADGVEKCVVWAAVCSLLWPALTSTGIDVKVIGLLFVAKFHSSFEYFSFFGLFQKVIFRISS